MYVIDARGSSRPHLARWHARHWAPRGLAATRPRWATSRVLREGPALWHINDRENVEMSEMGVMFHFGWQYRHAVWVPAGSRPQPVQRSQCR